MLQEENKQLILQMAEARTQIYSIISPLADQAEAGYTDPEQKIEVAKTLSAQEGGHQMDLYKRFLDDANEFLGLLRKDKQEGKYTEKGFEALSSQYNCTISSYNYFAD